MSNSDFIPHSDVEFDLWQDSLIAIAEPNIATWGITADAFTTIKTTQTAWKTAFSKASNKQNRTSADVQAKDDGRKAHEKVLRPFIAQWLTNNSKVTNSDRDRMGLTVRSGTRTPAATPVTFPVGKIDYSMRLQHTIHFTDVATPRSKAKPDGIHGCEIWMKIGGDAPKDVSELDYLATETSSPRVKDFEGAHAGKTVYYWLRWVNTRNQPGPWGNPVSAIIAG